jgi:hypothetical protein
MEKQSWTDSTKQRIWRIRNRGSIIRVSENIIDGPFHPSSHQKRGKLRSEKA